MNKHDLSKWSNTHQFNKEKKQSEFKTLLVILITMSVMAIEIFAGWYYNSVALFADGWHMLTHAAALSISLIAYILARKLKKDRRFTFGTWKIEILGAYTSAIVLIFVGLFVLYVSFERIFNPVRIGYNQALLVAVIGLVVNLLSIFILKSGSNHEHSHEHSHKQGPNGHKNSHHNNEEAKMNNLDLNLRSAYVHILTDALTSMLAIIALLGAKYFGWDFLDPLMGIVGATLIFRWTFFLIRDTSAILLDREMDERVLAKIIEALESDGDTEVADIHIWRVGENKFACLISLVADEPATVEDYKKRLQGFSEIYHLTIEVNSCNGNFN